MGIFNYSHSNVLQPWQILLLHKNHPLDLIYLVEVIVIWFAAKDLLRNATSMMDTFAFQQT